MQLLPVESVATHAKSSGETDHVRELFSKRSETCNVRRACCQAVLVGITKGETLTILLPGIGWSTTSPVNRLVLTAPRVKVPLSSWVQSLPKRASWMPKRRSERVSFD